MNDFDRLSPRVLVSLIGLHVNAKLEFAVDVADGKSNHLPVHVRLVSNSVRRRNVMSARSDSHFSVLRTHGQEVALYRYRLS